MDLDGLYSNLNIYLILKYFLKFFFENFAALITTVMSQMDIKFITEREQCLISSQHHLMSA